MLSIPAEWLSEHTETRHRDPGEDSWILYLFLGLIRVEERQSTESRDQESIIPTEDRVNLLSFHLMLKINVLCTSCTMIHQFLESRSVHFESLERPA